MKTGTLLNKWTAALVALVLMISLFAIPAFAEETTAEVTTATTAVESTAADTTAEASTASTTVATTAAATTGVGSTTTEDKKDGLSVTAIVFIIIGIVLLAVGVVFLVKYREKVGKYLKVLKGEGKKIVWLPWDQTKKNTLVVVIVLIVCAAVIFLVDLGLQEGILAFIDLFHKH